MPGVRAGDKESPKSSKRYWPTSCEEACHVEAVHQSLVVLVGAVLFISAVALAEKPKTITIYSDSVLPSGQELKAGEYQVNVNETSKEVTFKKGNKVVATAAAKL